MPEPRPARVAVLVSGGGSNLEALFQAKERGELPVDFVLVLSSRPGAFALERARNRGVPTRAVDWKAFPNEDAVQATILAELNGAQADIVVLAGYMRKLSPAIVGRFRGRMLNIHPALLPKFGGAGMYGHHVHEAVLKAGEKESGCSVHLVDEEFDHGQVLAQARVPVESGDTAEILASRVLEQEHKLYPVVLRDFCKKEGFA